MYRHTNIQTDTIMRTQVLPAETDIECIFIQTDVGYTDRNPTSCRRNQLVFMSFRFIIIRSLSQEKSVKRLKCIDISCVV